VSGGGLSSKWGLGPGFQGLTFAICDFDFEMRSRRGTWLGRAAVLCCAVTATFASYRA